MAKPPGKAIIDKVSFTKNQDAYASEKHEKGSRWLPLADSI
jgi:hypothetical protein